LVQRGCCRRPGRIFWAASIRSCAQRRRRAGPTFSNHPFLPRPPVARAERRRVRDALILSLTEHALANGITTYVAIAAPSWARQIEAFGWDCAPLGPPRQIEDDSLVALRIAITPRTPALLEAAGLVSPALPGERVLAA
jgi:acyl-homoserine lactone synthase